MIPPLFKEELFSIQKRHAIVFPIGQLKYIDTENQDGHVELKFLKGYDLSTVITMEIELAFKIMFGQPSIQSREK